MEMHTTRSRPDARGRVPGPISRIGSEIRTLANAFVRWRRYRRNLNDFYRMDDRTLADLGLTRGDLERAVRYGRESLPPGR